MAVTTFKPSIWESAIMEDFATISLVEAVTTAPTSVEGKEAIFNVLGDIAIKDYTGEVNFDELTTTSVTLIYDQKKYFAVKVDDVDKIQAKGELMQPAVRKASQAIKKAIDTLVFAEMAKGAKAGNKIGSSSAQKNVATPEDAYNYVVDMGTKLDENDVPEGQRFVIARPEFINLLAKDKRVIDNAQVLDNGIVQGMDVNGMVVCKSNNVPANTVLALTKEATGFGKEIEKTEALRLESAFADGVRGLFVYGTKTLRDNGIVTLTYKLA